MRIKFKNYLGDSLCFLLLQVILLCNASSVQSAMEEQSQKDTLNKGVGQLSIQQRDSDTSEESIMKSDPRPTHSIAHVIFERACRIIPHLENPEDIKPNIKDRFTLEYSKKFNTYDKLKTLNQYFLEAINGDIESKEHLSLWLLKGIKDISKDFYERYADDPSNGKSLLKAHIEQLLKEYCDYIDPELDIDANVLLEDLDYYAEQW